MKSSNNLWKILRVAGLLFGLPLILLAGLLIFLLGQIGIVGIADRIGISPLIGFNALNVFLIAACAGFLILTKQQSVKFGFSRWRRYFALPRFVFPNLNFWSWKPSQSGQNPATSDTAFTPLQAKEPVCKILFIHYQPAAHGDATGETLTFDDQNNGERTYAYTNNFYET